MCPFVGRHESQCEGLDQQLNSDHCLVKDNVERVQRLALSIPDLNQNEIKKQLSKSMRSYYKSQADLLNSVLEFENESRTYQGDDNDEGGNRWHVSPQMMAKITFLVNFGLFCGKCVAAAFSGSLAVISSVLDSAVDLVSGVLLWFSNRAIKNTDHSVYPRGRGRLEPVSIVILAVIMSLASFQVSINSLETIVTYVNYDLHCRLNDYFNETDLMCGDIKNLTELFLPCSVGKTGPVMELPTIIICSSTIAIKLIMFLMYRRISNSTIKALAQDHRNDVISNSIALFFGFLGYKVLKYIDPIGAITMALYIIITWSLTATEQIRVITGVTANRELLNALTWFILGHHPQIRYIDDLRAFYHSCEGYVVEVDIILPSDMGIKDSHDIGEHLRLRLEKLNWVDKAYVHVDYACNNYKQMYHVTKV